MATTEFFFINETVNQNQSQLKVFQETENALRHEISQLKHASLNVQRRDPRVPHDIHDNRLEMRDNINQIRDPRATHHLYDRAHDTRERRDNDLRDPRAVGRMQNEDDRGSRTPERIDTNEGYPYSRDNYHNNYNDNINYEFENKKRKLDSMNAREKQSNIHNYSHSRGY